VNYCTSCDCDFSSVAAFDRHRIGTHAYTNAEGLKMEPLREDGRRCMEVDEMTAAGMELNSKGRWYDFDAAERVRERFAQAA
jgi:hypothetical protein